jgi:hypothetical protein
MFLAVPTTPASLPIPTTPPLPLHPLSNSQHPASQPQQLPQFSALPALHSQRHSLPQLSMLMLQSAMSLLIILFITKMAQI